MLGQRTLSAPRLTNLGTSARRLAPSWLLIVVLGWLTLYPLFMLFVASFQGSQEGGALTLNNYQRAFADPGTWRVFWTTLWLALVRVGISLIVTVFLAWAITRTNVPWRRGFEVMIWLLFFLPSLPVTMGWILIGSPPGVVNKLLELLPFVHGPVVNIYSYWGIIFVSTLQMSAFMFLLTAPVFRSLDANLEEAAWISGAGAFTTIRRVILPLALPGILEAAFYTFIFALESFETELLLGIPARIYVFSTQIYELANDYPTDIPKATALGMLFLVFIVVLIGIRLRVLRGKMFTVITGKGYTPRIAALKRSTKWIVFGVLMLYVFLAAVIPLLMLVLGSFIKVWGVWNTQMFTLYNWKITLGDQRLLGAIWNTAFLGLLVGIGVVIATSLATYVMVRTRLAGRRLLEFITWAPRMAPAPVLAIAFIEAYVGGTNFFRPILGTVFMLAIVLFVNFVPLGTRTMSGGMFQIANELEESARVSGAGWITTFRRVVLPLLTPALTTAFLLAFLLSTRNLVLVIFFYTAKSRVLSTMLWEEWTGSYTQQALVIGLIMTAMSAVVLAVVLLLGKRQGVSAAPR